MSNNTNIKSNEATITTATVDLQVVRIGAKQMTLAVFRQLPGKDLFKPDGGLVAPPWGWVNYDYRSYGKRPYVFSEDGVLYRDDVDIRAYHQEPYIAEVKIKGFDRMQQKETWASTGKWGVATRKNNQFVGDLDDRQFPSEEAGKVFLREWIKSAAVLDAAPQLFIGV